MPTALWLVTLLGAMTPWLLLALTFALGMGFAALLPAWQAIQPYLVSRSELPQAVILVGVNVNVSRAIGPAVGGLLIVAAGPAAVFLINVVLFYIFLCVFFRWKGSTHEDARPEIFAEALQAGLRFARNEPAIRAVLVRASLFMVGGSAVLALLPLAARRQLGLVSFSPVLIHRADERLYEKGLDGALPVVFVGTQSQNGDTEDAFG